MNLFALTHSDKDPVFRFPLDRMLQGFLQKEFGKQENFFFEGVDNEIAFDGEYTANEDEIFSVKLVKGFDEIRSAVSNPLSTPRFDENVLDLNQVKSLFCGSNAIDGRILLQKFSTRSIISSAKNSIFFSEDTFKKFSGSGFSLDDKLSIIMESDNSIKFHSYFLARQIFDLTEYFQEATNEQVQTFMGSSALDILDKELFLAQANQNIRRRLTSIMRSGVLHKVNKEALELESKKYGTNISFNEKGQIIIPKEKLEVKSILDLLSENFFESSFNKTAYVTNSKRKI